MYGYIFLVFVLEFYFRCRFVIGGVVLFLLVLDKRGNYSLEKGSDLFGGELVNVRVGVLILGGFFWF